MGCLIVQLLYLHKHHQIVNPRLIINSAAASVFDACLDVFTFEGNVNLTFALQNDVRQIDFEGRQIKCGAILFLSLSQLVSLSNPALSRGLHLHQTDA